MTEVQVGAAIWEVPDEGPAYVLLTYSRGEKVVVPAGDSKSGALLKAAELHERGNHFVMCIYSRVAKAIVANQLTDEMPGYIKSYRTELRKSGGRRWRKQ